MQRRIRARSQDVRLLAMLMMAEARGEGRLGQNLVGTVTANRIVANCKPDFIGIRTIPQAVYGKLGPSRSPFQPVQNGEIYKMSPRTSDINSAQNIVRGRIDRRAARALWFQNPNPGGNRGPCPYQMPRSPKTRFDFAFKNHCFYTGVSGYCPEYL